MIILADQDPEYLTNMKLQFDRQRTNLQLIPCRSLSELQEVFTAIGSSINLVIYNPVDFPGLPESLGDTGKQLVDFWPLIVGASGNQTDEQPVSVYRFCRICDLIAKLEKRQKDLASITLFPSENQHASPSPAVEFYLLMSATATGYQAAISRQRLRQMIGSGQRVIYLAIMPTYQMCCLSAPGIGPSLSDLLLKLMGKAISPEQISQYWQHNPNGYLQFRPPDRSDDLVLCHPDLLRHLIVILKERLEHDNEPSKVLIDCAGLPLSTISVIAVLCNICEIIMPGNDNFASEAARREISQFLALLPGTCTIRETRSDG